MKLIDPTYSIYSQSVEDSSMTAGSSRSVVNWVAEIDAAIDGVEGNSYFRHGAIGRTPGLALEALIRDLEASGVEQ